MSCCAQTKIRKVYVVDASEEEKPLSEFDWPSNDRVTITPDVDYLFLCVLFSPLFVRIFFKQTE
jgi:hypothetical protein